MQRIVVTLVMMTFGFSAIVQAQDRSKTPQLRRDRSQSRPLVANRSGPRLPPRFTVKRDLTYAQLGDDSLLLDVYYPTQPGEPLPLVVWVHGGAWRAGSKRSCPAVRLLSEGYVVASIDYRLTDQAIFPAQIHDCKAAIRWLRDNADQYRIDPKRIGVWGSSAGGHLVSLLGTSGDVTELEGSVGEVDQSSRVQAVCSFFGPTDFLKMDAHAIATARMKHNAADSPESILVGGPIQANPDRVARANPMTYITADDPPMLLVHGDQDPLVPHHQSVIFAEALRAGGVDVTFHTVVGGKHGFGRNAEVDALVDRFFDQHLKSAPLETDSDKSLIKQ
ncbi:MAG: alpha/beta hydrolase [Planctomycetota bacterium]